MHTHSKLDHRELFFSFLIRRVKSLRKKQLRTALLTLKNKMTLFAISLGAIEAFVLRLIPESLAELDPHSHSLKGKNSLGAWTSNKEDY